MLIITIWCVTGRIKLLMLIGQRSGVLRAFCYHTTKELYWPWRPRTAVLQKQKHVQVSLEHNLHNGARLAGIDDLYNCDRGYSYRCRYMQFSALK